MKRLLIPLLAAIALPTTVNANVDIEIHKLCKDVKDYMGCVQANKMESSSKNSKRSWKDGKWDASNDYESSTKSDYQPLDLDDDMYDFRETFVHKGKTYEATRACPDGTNMVWEYDWRSVWEVGCMSSNERDNYARELMQRKRQKANRMFQDSLKNFSNTINPPTTRCSTYGSGSSFNTTCKQY